VNAAEHFAALIWRANTHFLAAQAAAALTVTATQSEALDGTDTAASPMAADGE
jgi:hypothetical protein